MKVDTKTRVLSTLSAYNTLINNFPTLIGMDYNGSGENASAPVTFLLDIGGLFGLGRDWLLGVIKKALSDEDGDFDDADHPVRRGFLTVIEYLIKSALYVYFRGLYTCEVDPLIPDDFLRYTKNYASADIVSNTGTGVAIPLGTIDAFELLRNTPTSEAGSLFYFDIPQNPNDFYKSMDMNLWLWYIINQSTASSNNVWNNYKAWDNRILYRNQIQKSEDVRNAFIDDSLAEPSQLFKAGTYSNNVGQSINMFKKNIICAEFRENGFEISPYGKRLTNSNVLYVYGAKETYYKTGLLQRNKTISQFNADYIFSLKLFDTKTLVAQIINSIVGIADIASGQISLKLNIAMEEIKETIKKTLNKPARADDSYYEFSDEEYDKIVKNATLKYNGEYDTNTEAGFVVVDTDEIITAISKIDDAKTSEEKESAIEYSIDILGKKTDFTVGVNGSTTNMNDTFFKFLEETVLQLALQILTPKVMILFAINDYFLNGKESTATVNFETFIDGAINIINSCVYKILDFFIELLWDAVIGWLRPILSLIAKKLILETLTNYKEILLELIEHSIPLTLGLFNGKKNLVIDNVSSADIIPAKTEP